MSKIKLGRPKNEIKKINVCIRIKKSTDDIINIKKGKKSKMQYLSEIIEKRFASKPV